MQAVVMAGGKGERLLPAGESVPKPLVTVGGRPILAWTLEGLANRGFNKAFICVGADAEPIRNGLLGFRPVDLKLDYVTEDRPMGTIGALTLCNLDPREPCLVMNGDVLTTLDYGAFLQAHIEQENDWTISAHKAVYRARFGEVVTGPDGSLTQYNEKPVTTTRFSSGIYAIAPKVREWLAQHPDEAALPLPELLGKLGDQDFSVRAVDHECQWVDINDADDLQIARREMSLDLLSAVAGREPAPPIAGEPRFGERGWVL